MKLVKVINACLFSLLFLVISSIVNVSPVHASTWNAVAPLLFAPGGVNSATDHNGNIYAFGGNYDQNYNLVQKYDPNTDYWSFVAPMPTTRFSYASVTGADGKIYIFGGHNSVMTFNTVEAYDPNTDTWSCSVGDTSSGCVSSNIAPMPTARATLDGAGVLGPDGKIYIFGGTPGANGDPFSDLVEVYDPTTNSWACSTNDSASGCTTTDLSPLLYSRGTKAALGPDGKIYLVGGYSCNNGCDVIANVDTYDVNTNQWTTVSSLPVAKTNFGIATGADGKIYAYGGQINVNGDIVETTSTYSYDAYSDTWTILSPLPYPTRSLGSATGLDGRIYAVGGAANGNDIFYTNVVSLDTNNVLSLSSLLPAKVWVGLKNSDDVGVKFDLKAEVYAGSTFVSSGEINSVPAGSSGFNNAKLNTINFNSFSPVDFPSGTQLSIKLYVRNACVGSKHNSGVARLWYNDSQANSQFGATIGQNNSDYYVVSSASLSTSVGSGPRKTVDVQSGAKCSAFKPFGTWSITP